MTQTRDVNMKVRAQDIKANMTADEIAKLQLAIVQKMNFYGEKGFVLVVDEERRLTLPVYADWLDERHAFALEHLPVYDWESKERDQAEVNVKKTIRDAIYECGFGWDGGGLA